jgi:hypothetical protein
MARLWTAGAELQTVTAGIEFSATITNAPAVETTTKRSGNAAWRISNAAAIEGFRQIHTAAQGAFFFRFYLYVVARPTNDNWYIGGARQTGTNKIVLRMRTSGAINLFNVEDSAQIGSDSSALSLNTWYRIEMAYDSTTLSATTTSARIDGVEFASGTIDITATPNSLGCFTVGADATLDYIVDDLAINDSSGSFQNSWPGEGEVIVLRPNGNGDNSGWGGSDGNSTDNYLLIDETPPDTADYVEEDTDETIDDYNLEATPAAMDSSDTINVVHVGVYAAVNDATASDPNIALRIKASASGTVEESATLDVNSATFHGPAPLPANDNYQLTLYDLPGASTTAWTKADLDQAQAGIRVDIGDTHFARVAALWVMVDHKPTAGGTDYDQSASGGMTPSGAILKQDNKVVAGTVTSAGTQTRSASKVFAGTLTSGGAILKTASRLFTGTLAATGALIKATSKAFAGTLTSSGTLTSIRTYLKELAGTLTSSGAIIRDTSKSLLGTLSPSGLLNRLTSKTQAGILTSSGATTKTTDKPLGGSLTSSGAISRSIGKVVSGTLTTVGTISRVISKVLAGVLSLAGSLSSVFTGGGPETPITGAGMVAVIYARAVPTINAESVPDIRARAIKTTEV